MMAISHGNFILVDSVKTFTAKVVAVAVLTEVVKILVDNKSER